VHVFAFVNAIPGFPLLRSFFPSRLSCPSFFSAVFRVHQRGPVLAKQRASIAPMVGV